jgi:uncharacterized protein (TIGR00661 family)
MRFLFIVQGEGRGHLTQALALAEIVREAGHQVCAALVGSADGKTVQSFFQEAFKSEIIPFASPALVYHPRTKALSLPKTLSAVGKSFPRYCAGLRKVHRVVKEEAPDLIVNFYEVLGGLHSVFSSVPTLCVAHQYLLQHSCFPHPVGHRLDRMLVNLNSRLTALGAVRKLALSFYPAEAQGKIKVMPPLLRREVQEQQCSRDKFFLAYVTQAFMVEELLTWQSRRPEVELHCFSAGSEVGEVQPNFHRHTIAADRFLEYMGRCKGLITTAGFESVAEAMLLGKPVLTVPLPRHYEQVCNAIDSEKAGGGLYRTSFDPDVLEDWKGSLYTAEFRSWVEKAGPIFLQELTAVLGPRRYFTLRVPVLWRIVGRDLT